MRNLTIKREKRFVACLGKMKVYIEDADSDDLTINGSPCRFLGTLKNGEEKTFAVAEAAAKVFVIADKLSKGFCNEFYPLPEGQEDIVLAGRNCFNPASGNAFRFDGVTDEAVLKNRKKGVRIGIVVLIAAALVGFIIGFAPTLAALSGQGNPQEFTAENFQITLTSKFSETTVPNYTVAFESRDVIVLGLSESRNIFSDLGVDSLTDYSKVVQQANGHDETIHKDDGFLYYEYQYTDPSSGQTFHYYTMMYKGAFHFWIVQFATLEEKAEDYRQSIMQWARSVEVN